MMRAGFKSIRVCKGWERRAFGAMLPTSARGFTMIELVTVIVIVGVLAVIVMPRLNSNLFASRGFHDEVKSLLQHARRSAIASRRYQCVDVTNGGTVVALTRDTRDPDALANVACAEEIALPARGTGCANSNQVCAPRGVALGGATSVVFDPLGRLVAATAPKVVAAAAATFTLDDETNITVQPETGYVQ